MATDALRIEVHHEIKTWPIYFGAIWDRRKTFEVRPHDRPFRCFDAVNLLEWSPGAGGGYTGRSVLVEITYVLAGGAWGIAGDHCVFAFREISRKDC